MDQIEIPEALMVEAVHLAEALKDKKDLEDRISELRGKLAPHLPSDAWYLVPVPWQKKPKKMKQKVTENWDYSEQIEQMEEGIKGARELVTFLKREEEVNGTALFKGQTITTEVR
jgi:hypothetical protein